MKAGAAEKNFNFQYAIVQFFMEYSFIPHRMAKESNGSNAATLLKTKPRQSGEVPSLLKKIFQIFPITGTVINRFFTILGDFVFYF